MVTRNSFRTITKPPQPEQNRTRRKCAPSYEKWKKDNVLSAHDGDRSGVGGPARLRIASFVIGESITVLLFNSSFFEKKEFFFTKVCQNYSGTSCVLFDNFSIFLNTLFNPACSCLSGTCNETSGVCMCDPGYGGARCEYYFAVNSICFTDALVIDYAADPSTVVNINDW